MIKISRGLKHLVMLPVYALFFIVGAGTVQASTYYVAHTGNDAHTCATAQTITTPKLTFASAISCLDPGDTLYIRAGTWTESINTGAPPNTKVGTPGNPITIARYPGDAVGSVILQPVGAKYAIMPYHWDHIIFDGLVWDGINMDRSLNGVYACRIINTTNVTFQNFEWKRLWGLIYISGSNGVTIKDSKIHGFLTETGAVGTRYMGIYVHDGSNIVIDGNDIFNNPGGGMQIQPGPLTNVIVRNNKIHDNLWLPNQIGVGAIAVFRSSDGGPVTGTQIYNNVIWNHGVGATPGIATDNYAPGINVYSTNAATPGPDGTKIWNNTIYENWGFGINVSNSAIINTVIQNNIAYDNHGGLWPKGTGQINNGGTASTVDHNLTTNPAFVNAAAFNFLLQPNSPAIDAGEILSQVTTDIQKNPRPQGRTHDIGAYEVGTGSDTVPPSTPRGLMFK